VRLSICADLSDDSKRAALKILAGCFHLSDKVALRCSAPDVVQCLALCFALEAAVGAPLGRRPALISPASPRGTCSRSHSAASAASSCAVLMWPQPTLRFASSTPVLDALLQMVRAWVLVVGCDFAVSALSSFACESERNVAAAAMACACTICESFSADLSASAANSFCDVCSDLLVQCRNHRHSDMVLCLLLRCIGSVPMLTRCSSLSDRRTHALTVLTHRKSLLSIVISSIALAVDLPLIRSCIDTCLEAWSAALGWSHAVSCVLEHSDWVLDDAVSELRQWASSTLACSSSCQSEQYAAGLRGAAVLSYLAQANCSQHAESITTPLPVKLVVSEIVTVIEEALGVLSLSASMANPSHDSVTLATGFSKTAAALSHTEMVCVALLRCLELTIACINKREPWTSTRPASDSVVASTPPLVSLSELLSIFGSKHCRSSSPIERSHPKSLSKTCSRKLRVKTLRYPRKAVAFKTRVPPQTKIRPSHPGSQLWSEHWQRRRVS
jgi:hypothetical protein